MINLGCGNTHHPDWLNFDFRPADGVIPHNLKHRLPLADGSVRAVYQSHLLEHFRKEDGENMLRECYRVLEKNGIIRIVVPDLETICREYLKNLTLGFDTGSEMAIADYEWNKIEIFDQIIRRQTGGEMFRKLKSGPKNLDYIIARNGRELLPGAETAAPVRLYKNLKKLFFYLGRGRFNSLYYWLANFVRGKIISISGERHRWMYDRLDLKLLLDKIGFRDFQISAYDRSQIADWPKYAFDSSSVFGGPRKPDSLYVEARK
jgi:SAM-dependent methyltransferase